MKKSTKITIIAMSLVIALLIAAVGVLWYSLNTAETFANRSRTDIALGKYEILRDRSASPEKFLEAAKAKDYDIIIFSKEQTLALGEKSKSCSPTAMPTAGVSPLELKMLCRMTLQSSSTMKCSQTLKFPVCIAA